MTPVPPMPRLAALAVVVREQRVLLVRRRNPPDAGRWGFPGGHVEPGETALAAAVRELHEETGLRGKALEYLTNIDVIHRATGGTLTAHYLLAAVLCRCEGGEPVAADDALDAAFVTLGDLRAGALPASDRVEELARLALARMDQLPRPESRDKAAP